MTVVLAGCGGEQEELTQWMEQQKREVKPNVQPLSPPKKFVPQPYIALSGVEPFSAQKLTVALKQEAKQPNSLLAAEINRRKEPLEAYPLDSMNMVGSVTKSGRPYALLKVDNLLYQVKQGDYLGQNYGKITKISETDVSLREIVQDAAGEWIERREHPPAPGEGADEAARGSNDRRSEEHQSEIQMISKWRSRALAFAVFLGASVSAMAQNAIQSIDSTQQAGSEVVRIELSQPLAAVPAGFTIQTPPRIAIDLPGVTSALGKSSVEMNQATCARSTWRSPANARGSC